MCNDNKKIWQTHISFPHCRHPHRKDSIQRPRRPSAEKKEKKVEAVGENYCPISCLFRGRLNAFSRRNTVSYIFSSFAYKPYPQPHPLKDPSPCLLGASTGMVCCVSPSASMSQLIHCEHATLACRCRHHGRFAARLYKDRSTHSRNHSIIAVVEWLLDGLAGRRLGVCHNKA